MIEDAVSENPVSRACRHRNCCFKFIAPRTEIVGGPHIALEVLPPGEEMCSVRYTTHCPMCAFNFRKHPNWPAYKLAM